jgi:two-component system, response regulator YesN
MELTNVLKDSLSTFSNAVNITVNLLDQDGMILDTFGSPFTYCQLFQEATGKYCPCAQMHQHSCQQAAKLGEGYIFSCPAGLIHFAAPIFKSKNHVASVLAGPISLEYADINLIDEVFRKYNISLDYRNKMYTALSAIPLVEPFRARYLTNLLFLYVTNLMSNEYAKTQELSEKSIQQAKIGEYIQLIKEDSETSLPQYELEKQLLSDVLSGNAPGAKAILNEMLGRIYFASGNNVEIIKTRAIELIAFLSRAIIENKGDETTIYHMTDTFLRHIAQTNDLTDLSYVLLEALEKFTNLAFSDVVSTNLVIIKKGIQYMNDHYNSNPTLDEVANYVGLNPTYFSTLFKQKTGVNFSGYMMKLKIDQGKRLLRESNLPLVTIAAELGFESQSYFSNIFKRFTDMTPKQYRENL